MIGRKMIPVNWSEDREVGYLQFIYYESCYYGGTDTSLKTVVKGLLHLLRGLLPTLYRYEDNLGWSLFGPGFPTRACGEAEVTHLFEIEWHPLEQRLELRTRTRG